MGENTGIEWAHHTVNFWIGCTKVSPACDFCYAERDWSMTGRHKRVEWGPHGSRSLTKSPMAALKAMSAGAQRRGRRERVFINSLSDWADNHPSITSGVRGAIFEAAKLFRNLDFLLLTKRPQNIARYLPADWGTGYHNVWMGTTAENQEEADRRIPHLLAAPAAIHFVSAEPLLGPIDFRQWLDVDARTGSADDGPFNTIDWIVCGGESGPGARPAHPDWFRSIRDQCKAAGVPFLFKQWGEWAPWDSDNWEIPDGWDDAEAHDRSMTIGGTEFLKVGKRRAGRLLDGVKHDEYPAGGK